MKFDQKMIASLIVAFCLGVTVGVAGLTLAKQIQPAPIVISPPPTPMPTPTLGVMTLFVNGQVQEAGVYQVPPQSRLEEAIAAAGGFTEVANTAVVNLAQPVVDGMQIYVPALDEGPTSPLVVVNAAVNGRGIGQSPLTTVDGSSMTADGSSMTADGLSMTVEGLLNINNASVADLDALPGIGPSTAQKILDYRDESGPFATIEEIMNVSGIGEAKFEQIKSLIMAQ